MNSIITLRTIALAALTSLVGLGSLSAQTRLSLEDCRSMARDHSRVLQQKDQEILAAGAKRQEVFTKFFPQVSARAGYLHMEKQFHLIDWDLPLGQLNFLIPDRVRSLGTVDLRNVWVGNLTAIQPIYLGGKLRNGYQMAGLAEQLQRELKATAATEVEDKVDEAYWQVVSLVSKERLVVQLVSLLNETVRNVDAAIAAGVSTKADGLSVRTKLSEAEVKLSQVRNGLQLSKMLLADLCGMDEQAEYSLADEGTLAVQLPQSGQYSEADVPAAIERRSEVRSLRLVDSIYSKRVKVATSELLPKVYGLASYSTTNPNIFNGQKKQFGGQYYLGVMLEIPISGLFSGTYARREAQAEHRVKQLELSEARSKISLQMKQALRNAEDARRALTASLHEVEMAKENMRYAEVGYREGVIPLINYTMAQTAWMSAQDGLIDAQIRVRLTESKLKNILAL